MSKYIDSNIINKLRGALSLSVTKKAHGERTASVALSDSGSFYYAGLVESDTNTFNITSEQVALTLSVIGNDYQVSKIITMVEAPTSQNIVSPIVLKIITDHFMRTGQKIEYTIINIEGRVLFSSKETGSALPHYKPEPIVLQRVTQKPRPYMAEVKNNDKKDMPALLKSYAIQGLDKNFPLYDSASGYATSVLTANNKIFFAGQYSSPDKRLGLHSEVNVVLAALMNNEASITHLGLVSTKYSDSPCNMCGNCRQFLSEIISRYKLSPTIYLFAKDTDEYNECDINNYLPSSWTSKNWK